MPRTLSLAFWVAYANATIRAVLANLAAQMDSYPNVGDPGEYHHRAIL